MIITAGMICFLLKQQFNGEICLVGNSQSEVEHLRLAKEAPRAAATLYIMDENAPGKQSVQRLLSSAQAANGDAESVRLPTYLLCRNVDPYEVLEAAFGIYAQLLRWDQRLLETSAADAPLGALVSLGEELIPYPFALLSQEFLVIERSARFFRGESSLRGGQDYQLPISYVDSLVDNPDYPASMDLRAPYYFPLSAAPTDYVTNIVLNNAYLGRLMVELPQGETELEQGICHIIQHFYGYLSKAYLRFSGNAMTSQSQNDAVHTVMRQILAGPGVVRPDTVAKAVSLYGWSPDSLYSVVRLNFMERSKWDVASLYVARLLETNWPGTCAVIDGRSIVWIINESFEPALEVGEGFAEKSRIPVEDLARIAEGHACQAGMSEPFRGLINLEAYARQAELALEIGRLKSPHFEYHLFSEYKLDYLLSQVTRDFTAEQICHRGLLRLKDYDAKNGTDYFHCLKTYVALGQNVTHTADALFVHRTTLLRWLDRIFAISGVDLQQQDQLFYVMLSFIVTEAPRM